MACIIHMLAPPLSLLYGIVLILALTICTNLFYDFVEGYWAGVSTTEYAAITIGYVEIDDASAIFATGFSYIMLAMDIGAIFVILDLMRRNAVAVGGY